MPQHTVSPQKQTLGLVEFVSLMAFITSMVALSIDTMLPALSQIGQQLGAQQAQQSQLIISMLILGMALGQLFFGALSDAKGRKFAIQSGLVIFALGSVVCMYASNMQMMLLGRFIQGIGVSGPRISSMALIRDQYQGEAMARIMSFITMVFILVPMIAPALGQLVLLSFNWQAIFALFLFIAVLVSLWLGLRQPETLAVGDRRPLSWQNLRQALVFILTHRQVMGYALAAGLVFGAFLAYLSTSQTLFQHIYQVGSYFPLFFAILALAIGLASFANAKLVMRLGMLRLSVLALSGMVLFSTVLLLVCWSMGLPPLWLFTGLLMLTFFCVGILFGNFNALAMQPLGEMAGIGAALIGSITNLISVPTAILIGTFVIDDVKPVAVGFAVCGILSLVSVKWARP